MKLFKIWNSLCSRLGTEEQNEYSDLIGKDSQEVSSKFPGSVFFIVGNEFCERFSFYGIRTILVMYLTSELLMTEDKATSSYHGWTFLCYFMSILGAILADSWLGRYKTILYLSLVYLMGNFVMALAATRPLFPTLNARLINAGSLSSSLLTPILRKDVSCFGGDCFTLAFGVPGVLMLLSIVLFLSGSRQYKIAARTTNVTFEVLKCIGFAAYQKIASDPITRENPKCSTSFLDLARDKFPPRLIADIRKLLNVLLLFLPLPFFWSLFDQQGSRWTFQAAKMNGQLGTLTIKPDQMQVLNPLLIMFLIPTFDSIVYPLLDSFHLLPKALHRMFIGGLFASLAFVAAGILQIEMESFSLRKEASVSLEMINGFSCVVQLEMKNQRNLQVIYPHQMILSYLDSWSVNQDSNTPNGQKSDLLTISARVLKCPLLSNNTRAIKSFSIRNHQEILVLNSYFGNLELVKLPEESHQLKLNRKPTQIRFIDTSDVLRSSKEVGLRRKEDTRMLKSAFYSKGVSATASQDISHGRYDIFLRDSLTNEEKGPLKDDASLGFFTAERNTSQTVLIYNVFERGKMVQRMKVLQSQTVPIHILWIVPQYVLISIAEIMFTITGLEFAFKQAPESMKSIVQSCWLLTIAFGNLIMVFVAEIKLFEKQSTEFFVFAALMIVDIFLFLLLSNRFYKKSDESSSEGGCCDGWQYQEHGSGGYGSGGDSDVSEAINKVFKSSDSEYEDNDECIQDTSL